VNGVSVDLLHRRLSILDLSAAGKQPMISSDRRIEIAFNGEIYNHIELRRHVQGVKFNGHSDTETIVNLFSQLGVVPALKKLNGIFAVAILDLVTGELHLARDRFGVKPLYYHFGDDRLLFSSEIRPLKALLSPEVDFGSLAECLQLRYTPSPNTFYDAIKKVEPGQILTFKVQLPLVTTKSYFTTYSKSFGSVRDDHMKVVQEYGDLFEKAVERQLLSDVEIGILLSGGVDSALVTAVAKDKAKKPVKTFTIGYKGEYSGIDEINAAEESARTLGVENLSRRITFSDLMSSINMISGIVEEPIGTTSIIPMYFLSQLAASKVKVVLSGQGADEPLGGYKKYRALSLLSQTRKLRQLIPANGKFEAVYQKREFFRRFISSAQGDDAIRSFINFNSILASDDVIRLITPDSRRVFARSLKNRQELFYHRLKRIAFDSKNLRDLFLFLDTRTSLSDDLLMYTDKITMNFGLECRVPILDNDLMDYVESLNSRHKFDSFRGKIVHRAFAREYLPASIVDRKKVDFRSPTNVWFRENILAIQESLESNGVFRKIFDMAAVNQMLFSHKSGSNLEKQIFLLLSIARILNNQNSSVDIYNSSHVPTNTLV
jgi:asparagine synthase (glutamine-hydrolysing)